MAKIGLHDELSLRPAAYNLESPLIELPLYLGLGVVAGLVAVMFKFFSRKVSGAGQVVDVVVVAAVAVVVVIVVSIWVDSSAVGSASVHWFLVGIRVGV